MKWLALAARCADQALQLIALPFLLIGWCATPILWAAAWCRDWAREWDPRRWDRDQDPRSDHRSRWP